MTRSLACLVLLLAGSWASAQAPAPTATVQSMLIKNTLTALNHATITGNYTVLRDLGSDQFRQRKASDLADLFRALREQRIDLSQVLIREPQLTQAVLDSPAGRLRLAGGVATAPRVTRFDLTFVWANGGWMIDEIGLTLNEPAPPVAVTQAVPPPRAPRIDPRVQQAAAWVPKRLPAVR